MFLIAPAVGILAALAAVVAEQLLAVVANIFLQKEITATVYSNLNFFLVAAAIIEESLKYFAASYVLQKKYGLQKYRFILSSAVAGFFFGLTEIYFVLLANGRKITDIAHLEGETLLSLAGVILLHVLAIFLMAALIATRREISGLGWLRIIIFPVFVHLFFNFLVIQRSGFTNWLIGIVFAITFLTSVAILAFNRRELD